ncbi:MAG TPA: peptide chain release factor 2 [Alphaproteobacteria bacterium]|nr:peptide chain release factor 2 [Alphaproteobacteria bacterium]
MNAEISNIIKKIYTSMNSIRRHLDPENSVIKLKELNKLVEAPNLWDDQISAQQLMKDRTYLEDRLTNYQELEFDIKDNISILELADAENDNDLLEEGKNKLEELYISIKKIELETLLSGEADINDCFLEINAGAGGTESQDWAQMILRMYSRWAEKQHYKISIMDENQGDEVGIKSICIRISGINAYGWLKTESGVHRLVRISPFDSQNRRHTSFASVWVYPVVDDNIEININEKDLRIDTYRASGAGGQHVNRTDSAVRITHIPTNTVVQCQNHRSQHQNKAEVYKMLRAKLYELALSKKEKEKNETESNKTEIGWGHQIRSYVLQPYQLVKDLRTNKESSNFQAILDGEIDMFLEESLANKLL